MLKKEEVGLWIPYEIKHSALTMAEKVVLSDILALSSDDRQYYKTNQAIANEWNVSLRTVNTIIKKLVDCGLITSHISYPYGNVKKRRVIRPVPTNIKKLKI